MERFRLNQLTLFCIVSLIGIFSISIAYADKAPSNISFIKSLRLEHEKKYQILVEKIKSMTQEEYDAYKVDRINLSYNTDAEVLENRILIEVTDELNQPQVFFAKLLSSNVNKEDIGINKIREILAHNLKSKGEPARFDSNRKLSFLSHIESPSSDMEYQEISVGLTQSEVLQLAKEESILDVFPLSSPSKSGATLISIYSPKGRILPQKKGLVVEKEVLKKGWYAELINKFQEQDEILVRVDFSWSDDFYKRRPFNNEWVVMHNDMANDFLSSWEKYKFKTFSVKAAYATIKTTQSHVEEMYKDSRVSLLSTGAVL